MQVRWSSGPAKIPLDRPKSSSDHFWVYGVMRNLRFCSTQVTLYPCRFSQSNRYPNKVGVFEEISISTFQKYILLIGCEVCEKSCDGLKTIEFRKFPEVTGIESRIDTPLPFWASREIASTPRKKLVRDKIGFLINRNALIWSGVGKQTDCGRAEVVWVVQ